jgi:choline dehydrogenase-like flavoprotein
MDVVYDVIIAGAGPVGLFLASELRLAKLSVLVLEQAEDPCSPLKQLPFGMRGLWGPSIEAFYRRGLLAQIASQLGPRRDGSANPRWRVSLPEPIDSNAFHRIVPSLGGRSTSVFRHRSTVAEGSSMSQERILCKIFASGARVKRRWTPFRRW